MNSLWKAKKKLTKLVRRGKKNFTEKFSINEHALKFYQSFITLKLSVKFSKKIFLNLLKQFIGFIHLKLHEIAFYTIEKNHSKTIFLVVFFFNLENTNFSFSHIEKCVRENFHWKSLSIFLRMRERKEKRDEKKLLNSSVKKNDDDFSKTEKIFQVQERFFLAQW